MLNTGGGYIWRIFIPLSQTISRINDNVKYLLFFSNFLFFPLNAQYKGNIYKIIDSSSKREIQNAHVNNYDNQIVAITNDSGEFELRSNTFKRDTLRVSCIGYKSTSFNINLLLKEEKILMDADTLMLNEVVIRPISPKEMVKKSISLVPINYLDPEIIINGNFELSIKKNADFFRYSKAEILMKIRPKSYEPEISKIRYISQSGDSTGINEDMELLKESFLFDHLIQGRGFLNITNIDSWKFNINCYTVYEGKEVAVIEAAFISWGSVSHFGKLYINQEDFAILKVEYRYKWHKRNLKKSKIDSLWINNSGWLGSIYYKKAKEKYRLLNLGYTIEKETYYKDESFHFKKLDNYEVTSDFVSN